MHGKLKYKYYIVRSMVGRKSRMLFVSPAEIRFIRLMGGRVVTFPQTKHPRTGFPLAYVITLGRQLKHGGYDREVRVGSKFIDFGCERRRRGIEIDGRNFHRDIVHEQQRDDYVERYGWVLMHVQASDLWREPDRIKREIAKFIA